MVKLVELEEVRKGLRIGVHANGKWYARVGAWDVTTKKDKTRDVSLKLNFEKNSPSNKNEAIEKARKIADKIGERLGKSSNPFKEYLISDLGNEWLKIIKFCADENEELAAQDKPMKYEVFGFGSKGYWTKIRYDLAVTMNGHLQDFFETLPTQEITKIRAEHLDRFAT